MSDFDLGAELTIGLAESRRDAESRMLDTCTIRRPTGTTTDRPTGKVVATYSPVYAGRCRLVDTEGVVSTPEAGGATFTLRRTRLDVPVGTGPVEDGDVLTVDASVTHPDIAGATGRVTSVPVGTQVTALRLGVEEVS